VLNISIQNGGNMDNTATTQRNREDKVKRKERVRGPKLAILVKRANGVPFVEGLRMAEEKGRVIASNASWTRH